MNFLNKKQVKDLQKKDWEVKPKGFYVTVYSSDFDYSSDWEAICDQAGVSHDSSEVTVLCFGVKTS